MHLDLIEIHKRGSGGQDLVQIASGVVARRGRQAEQVRPMFGDESALVDVRAESSSLRRRGGQMKKEPNQLNIDV